MGGITNMLVLFRIILVDAKLLMLMTEIHIVFILSYTMNGVGNK